MLVVVDQSASIGALATSVARSLRIDVADLPKLVMSRIANLHTGKTKIDARDAYVSDHSGSHRAECDRPRNPCRRVRLPQLATTLTGCWLNGDRATERIEEMLDDHPLSQVLTSMPGIGVRSQSTHPPRGRRRLRLPHQRTPRRLRRTRTRDPSLGHLDPQRAPQQSRKQTTHTSLLPRRVRRAARPRQSGLVRQQESRR